MASPTKTASKKPVTAAKAPVKKPAAASVAVKKTVAPAKAAAKPVAKPAAKPAPATKPAVATKKAPVVRASAASKAAVGVDQRRHYVEVAAYFLAERNGFPAGNELEHWAAAEAEIDRLLAAGLINL